MDDVLDSLLADLQSATRPGHMSTLSASRPSALTSSAMRSSESSYEYSRKYTETSSSSRSLQGPITGTTRESKTDVSELDNLLQQVKTPAVTSSPASSHLRANGREESPVVDTRNTAAVSKLVADLEHDLQHPESPRRWKNVRGSEVKPITTTTFYEESNTTYEVRPTTLVPPPKPIVSPSKPIVRESVREFESLSNSLSDLKVREPQPKPLKSSAPNLQTVEVLPKGNCCVCKKPIYGQVVSALGKAWHLECFTCYHCGIELGRENFFERDGKPYCENDYYNLFSPKCAYCSQPIIDKCVSALGKTWHPGCFNCCNCNSQFGDEGYHEMDGKAYCRDCYYDLYAPKCAGCGNAITDNYISALDGQWHPDCFVCYECRCPFVGGSFFDLEGKPYCETHYHLKRGSLCAGCHKPIVGRCVTAMFRKFHPEHFVCAFCLKQLNKGTFKEQNDKPYCHPCFDKLFS